MKKEYPKGNPKHPELNEPALGYNVPETCSHNTSEMPGDLLLMAYEDAKHSVKDGNAYTPQQAKEILDELLR